MNEAYIKPLLEQADKILYRLGDGRFDDIIEARAMVAERKGLLKAVKVLRDGPAAKLDNVEDFE